MSKKTTDEETRTSIDDLNDSLTGISAKVQKNMKVLSIIGIVIALIVVAVIVYIFLVRKPAVNKQNNAIAQADREMLMRATTLSPPPCIRKWPKAAMMQPTAPNLWRQSVCITMANMTRLSNI